MRKVWMVVVRITPILVLGMFCAILYLNRERFSEAEGELLPLMVVASFLFLLTRVVVAFAAFMTLRSSVASVRYPTLVLLDLSTSFLNYLPLKAGLLFKALYLKTVEGIEYSRFVASMFMVNSAQIMTALALVLIAGAFLIHLDAEPVLLRLGLLGAAVLLIFAVFFTVGPLSRMIVRLDFCPRYVNSWARSVSNMNSSVGQVTIQAALGLTVGLFVSIRLYLCFLMVGSDVSILAAILMAMLAVPARLVAIMPGGLGLREAMIVGGGVLAGVPAELALAAASLDRLIQFSTLALAGGIATIPLHRRFRSVQETQEECRGQCPNL